MCLHVVDGRSQLGRESMEKLFDLASNIMLGPPPHGERDCAKRQTVSCVSLLPACHQ